jgi:hypothetical protein
MAEEYLRTKVNVIIEPMVNAMLLATPQNPVYFFYIS